MMRSLCLAVLLSLVVPGSAVAGAGFGWAAPDWGCGGEFAPFPCNRNSGSEALEVTLQMSWTPISPADIVGAHAVIYFGSPTDWWRFDSPGGCRAGALRVELEVPGSTYCPSLLGGRGSVSWATSVADNRQIEVTVTANAPPPPDLQLDSQFVLFRVLISNERTVGPDSCSGCSHGAFAALRELVLFVRTPEGGYRNACVSVMNGVCADWPGWETACGSSPYPPPIECSSPGLEWTGAPASTWGALKLRYR